MGTEDFFHRPDRVREPDPTLGKSWPRRPESPPREPAQPPETGPPPPRPRRQRVVLADPRLAANTLRARVELEEQTSWGELLIKDLIKVQLRTGFLLAFLVVALLGSVPITFYLMPSFAAIHVIGVPVPWLILGVLPFPLLFGVGLWYNRLADRHERDFVDMIEN